MPARRVPDVVAFRKRAEPVTVELKMIAGDPTGPTYPSDGAAPEIPALTKSPFARDTVPAVATLSQCPVTVLKSDAWRSTSRALET